MKPSKFILLGAAILGTILMVGCNGGQEASEPTTVQGDYNSATDADAAAKGKSKQPFDPASDNKASGR